MDETMQAIQEDLDQLIEDSRTVKEDHGMGIYAFRGLEDGVGLEEGDEDHSKDGLNAFEDPFLDPEDPQGLEDGIGLEETDFEDGADISMDLPEDSLIHRKVHLEIAKILCGYVTEL